MSTKTSKFLQLARRLGVAYLTVSAGMFVFGFTSTLLYQLNQ